MMLMTGVLATTLFFAGDSTLDDHGFKYPYRSWGREAGLLMTDGNVISNFAQSGASTKSFVADGQWSRLIAAVQSGDFVLIEFGHNDQKRTTEFQREKRFADPKGLFREIVRSWVADVRTHGATPILASPICRGIFDEAGRVVDGGLGVYRDAMRDLSVELRCDYVDMNTLTRKEMERIGKDETEKFFVYSTGVIREKDGEPARDLSHPIKLGAETFARLFIEDVARRGLSVAGLFGRASAKTNEVCSVYRTINITDAPFEMPDLKEFIYPKHDFIITDFGAKEGVKCTKALAAAMKACEAAGGGRVVVPRGTWLTGAVRFRSNCNLHLDDGAVLEFTDDPNDYPKVHTTWEGVECLNHSPLLFAYGVENVAITGGGLIRPRMDFWRTWFTRPPAHMHATECLYHWCATNAPMAARDLMAIKGSNVRPHLIQFNRCTNVLIDGVHIKESPFWMIHLYHSENCVVRNVSAYAHGHNNDGVDVDMSQNVLIEKCSFDQGDDGIVLKAGRNADAWRLNRPTMNVVVRDCDLHTSHSLLGIGSELSGGVKNVWMTHCRADMTYNAFKIKTSPRRGGFVENVWMDHCSVGEVLRVATVQTDYYCQWKAFPDYERRYTRIRNINIDGLDVRKAEVAIQLDGDWHCRPKGLHFSNISVGAVLEQFTDIRNCEDVTLENVKLREDDGKQIFYLNRFLPVTGKVGELSEGHRRAAAFFLRPDYTDGTLADGVYDLGAGAVAAVEEVELLPFNEAKTFVDADHDRFYGLVRPGDICWFVAGDYNQVLGLEHDAWIYFPAGYRFCDRITHGLSGKVRIVTIKIVR